MIGVYKDLNLKSKKKDIVIHNYLEFLTTQENKGLAEFFNYDSDNQ